MEHVQEYKYLGHWISSRKDNTIHISKMRNKSIGIIKKIFSAMESFKLGKYYFECGIILKNSLLRRSILYSSETCYNLKEEELREYEKIEENYLRILTGSERGCPISQLYLETGQYPIRFEIFKMQILFYYYIINQKQSSTLYRFLEVQKKNIVKGDWYHMVQNKIKYISFQYTDQDMKSMKKSK